MAMKPWVVRGLLVLAAVLTVFSLFAVWVNRQALQTDYWVDRSGALIEDQAIRQAIADNLADQVIAQADLDQRLQQQLPPDFKRLAPIIAGGVARAAPDIADKLLASPRVQQLWRQANKQAHQQVVAIIEGKERPGLTTANGNVVLHLRPIAERIADRFGLDPKAIDKLPPTLGDIVIVKSDELKAVQNGAKLLKTLAWLLPVLVLLCLLGAFFLTPNGERKKIITAAGSIFLGAGVAVLLLRNILGSVIVDKLAPDGPNHEAAEHVWSIGTELLRVSAFAMALVGLIILISSWIAGKSRPATATRYALAPAIRDKPGILYSAVVIFYLFILWTGLVPATRAILPSLLMLALLVAGAYTLRRQVTEEVPEGGGFPHVKMPWAGRHERNQLDSLERLARLRDSGAITEQEYAAQKTALMGS